MAFYNMLRSLNFKDKLNSETDFNNQRFAIQKSKLKSIKFINSYFYGVKVE